MGGSSLPAEINGSTLSRFLVSLQHLINLLAPHLLAESEFETGMEANTANGRRKSNSDEIPLANLDPAIFRSRRVSRKIDESALPIKPQ